MSNTETTKQQQKKRELPPHLWKKGQSGNPAGRPKGTKNFSVLFREALKKIAKQKNIDPNSIEVDLVLKAIEKAKGGEYKYHKDIFDRVYGQPKQTIGLDDEDFITKITLEIKDGKDTTDNISDEEELEGVSEQEE